MKYEFTRQYVIGFHGAQGSGKDTLAYGVKRGAHWCFVRPLADPLKAAAGHLFCELGNLVLNGTQAQKDSTVDPYEMSCREILQKMGDFTYTVDPHAFSRSLANFAERVLSPILVPDFRRLSEFEYDYGCPKIVIGLTRNMHKVPTHHTDTLMFNKCSHVVHNADMTKEETLADAIEFLLRHGAIREL